MKKNQMDIIILKNAIQKIKVKRLSSKINMTEERLSQCTWRWNSRNYPDEQEKENTHKRERNKAFKICRKIINNPHICVIQILEREEKESKAEKEKGLKISKVQ